MVTILPRLSGQGERKLKNHQNDLFRGLRLTHHPQEAQPVFCNSTIILLFLDLLIYAFLQWLSCVFCMPKCWLQRPSALAQEPQESVAAEKHRVLTRATRQLFMCASLVADQGPANNMRERVSSSRCVGQGWRVMRLCHCRWAHLECMLRPGVGWGLRISRSKRNLRRDLWTIESHQTKPSIPVFIFISIAFPYNCSTFFFKGMFPKPQSFETLKRNKWTRT